MFHTCGLNAGILQVSGVNRLLDKDSNWRKKLQTFFPTACAETAPCLYRALKVIEVLDD
jgi:hypothetical protein